MIKSPQGDLIPFLFTNDEWAAKHIADTRESGQIVFVIDEDDNVIYERNAP